MIHWIGQTVGLEVLVCHPHQHDDNGDNGIEADNNAENNDATPRIYPTLSNV